MTRDDLVKDARNMEEIAERTASRCDIWQDRFIYWMAIAILHLLQEAIRRRDMG